MRSGGKNVGLPDKKSAEEINSSKKHGCGGKNIRSQKKITSPCPSVHPIFGLETNPYSKEPLTADEAWKCPECGTENKGKFCSECGIPEP